LFGVISSGFKTTTKSEASRGCGLLIVEVILGAHENKIADIKTEKMVAFIVVSQNKRN
jgi:hypothetical protein